MLITIKCQPANSVEDASTMYSKQSSLIPVDNQLVADSSMQNSIEGLVPNTHNSASTTTGLMSQFQSDTPIAGKYKVF